MKCVIAPYERGNSITGSGVESCWLAANQVNYVVRADANPDRRTLELSKARSFRDYYDDGFDRHAQAARG
jgi:hypothetical protein